MMTVEKLIETLQAIEDKSRKVVVIDSDALEHDIASIEPSGDYGEPVVGIFWE